MSAPNQTRSVIELKYEETGELIIYSGGSFQWSVNGEFGHAQGDTASFAVFTPNWTTRGTSEDIKSNSSESSSKLNVNGLLNPYQGSLEAPKVPSESRSSDFLLPILRTNTSINPGIYEIVSNNNNSTNSGIKTSTNISQAFDVRPTNNGRADRPFLVKPENLGSSSTKEVIDGFVERAIMFSFKNTEKVSRLQIQSFLQFQYGPYITKQVVNRCLYRLANLGKTIRHTDTSMWDVLS